jgi:glycine cleavage system H protein
MNVPANLLYTKDHEWLRVEGEFGYVGVTDFAQSELAICFLEIETAGKPFRRKRYSGPLKP